MISVCENKSLPLLFLFLLLSSCSAPSTKVIEANGIQLNVEPEAIVKSKPLKKFTNEKKAREFMTKRLSLIKNLIKPKIDPYTGKLLTLKKCQTQNLPKKIAFIDNKQVRETLFFYSATPAGLGQCFQNKDLLKTTYTVLYCKNSQEVYQVKTFHKDSGPWPRELSIKCH